MSDGDSVILFNFRGDRAIELCQAFDQDTFTRFHRGPKRKIFFAGMMQYDGDLQIPKHYLVEPPTINNTVAEHLEAAEKRTLAVSETQKFGHVTYFFNGNRGECPPAEAWREIPSLNVPFDEAPQMCAAPVTKVVCEAIRSKQFDHIRVNLANGDMVGHTGNLSATKEAVEYVDDCLGQMMQAVEDAGGRLIVTADHGNADQMYSIDKKTGGYAVDEQGNKRPHTSHSLHPVPFVVFDPTTQTELSVPSGPSVQGKIAQIGASLLVLCGVPVPSDYLPSLIRS
jgi:2,3-bisphosphoglycerate-independent phosphoglycerate mutase